MLKKSWPILLLFSLAGCGYTLSHRLKNSITSKRGVFVHVFDNKTDETGAEIAFTNALINVLHTNGDVTVTNDPAHSVNIHGTISKIDYSPTASYGGGFRGLQPWVTLPSEMGVTVSLSVAVSDPKKEFEEYSKDFSGFRRVAVPTNRTYDVESPSAFGPASQSSVESTFPDIARDIMQDVYDDLGEIL